MESRLDYLSQIIPALHVVQDYFLKLECEAEVQLMRLSPSTTKDRGKEFGDQSLHALKWLDFISQTVLSLKGNTLGSPEANNAANTGSGAILPMQHNAPPLLSQQPRQSLSVGPCRSTTGTSVASISPPASRANSVISTPATCSLVRDFRKAREPGETGVAGMLHEESHRGQKSPVRNSGSLSASVRPAGVRRSSPTSTASMPTTRQSKGHAFTASSMTFSAAVGSAAFSSTQPLSSPASSVGRNVGSQHGQPSSGGTPPQISPPIRSSGIPDVRLSAQPEVTPLTLGKGSWATEYRNATGKRRDALRLLGLCGIVTRRELEDDNTRVEPSHIDECAQIGVEMLQIRSLEEWPAQEAQRYFEHRFATLYQSKYPKSPRFTKRA